jgi:DNA-binding protein HU-beta
MNNADLIERIAAKHELSKSQVKDVIEGVFAAIADAASAGEEVALNGFGRFKVTERAARQGRNPATGEVIQIAAAKKLSFMAAKSIRDALNAPSPTGHNQQSDAAGEPSPASA